MNHETPATSAARARLLRSRQPGAHGKVTNIELFFDLVFVYAVTQLSHTLRHRPDAVGALQVLLLFLAVWWVWVFTSWVTNWLDPERLAVRLVLLALMLAGLLLSAALPEAFGGRGLLFAGAYVCMQVGRTAFALWAMRGSPANERNFQRILSWFVASGVLWIAGGLQQGVPRAACWVAALALEYLSPALGFRVPGLGYSRSSDWDVEGGHLAERCSLFVIIALGESVLAIGSSFATGDWTGLSAATFVIDFVGTAAMWWIYFDLGAERGSRAIRQSSDPGRTARLAYTYMHLLIVAGIIVCAVADEWVQHEPHERADAARLAILLGGPALYLLGNALFKRVVNGRNLPLSHLAGLGLLALAGMALRHGSMLQLGMATSAALLAVAIWEVCSLRSVRRWLQAGDGE